VRALDTFASSVHAPGVTTRTASKEVVEEEGATAVQTLQLLP
jgi:hypothetical protein